MDALTENHVQVLRSLIFVSPLLWGIWEFRQFRFKLDDIYKKTNELNLKLDKIAKNNLEEYPLLKDVKNLCDNLNKVFSISNK